jgi:hypothetical protein
MGVLKRLVPLGAVFFLLSGCADKKCDYSSDYIVQADGSETVSLNDSPNDAMVAQRFVPDSAVTVASISFTIKKVGDPQGELRISIHTEDNDRPKDDPITDGGPVTANLSGVGSDVLVEVKVDITGHPDLSSGRNYYIVFDSSEDPDNENYFQLGSVSTPSAYAGGEVWRFDSEETDKDRAWTEASTEDLQFTVKKCEQNKKQGSSSTN